MKSSAIVSLSLVASATAFVAPSLPAATRPASACAASMTAEQDVSRRAFFSNVASVAAAVALPSLALAEEAVVAPEKKPLGPAPTDWGMTKDYYTDANKMVGHMRYCTSLEKGAPGIEGLATNCRKEMTEFVSYYRRFPNVAGKLSYSNLYTSINVLAGHYASYGPRFPVPEKRKKRLLQEYNDIEKAIKRQR